MIKSIEVSDLRCHEHIQISLQPGLNFIIGKNGVGKTSLLEACEAVFQNSLFTGASNRDLIRAGQPKTNLKINLEVEKESIEARLIIDEKRITRSFTPTSYKTRLSKTQNIVSLCREDFELVSKEFTSKRNYLDEGAHIIYGESYRNLKAKFNKVLKQRNAILKNYPVNSQHLSTWTKLFDELTEAIREKRKNYIRELEILAPKLLEEIFDSPVRLEMVYQESEKQNEGEQYSEAIRARTTLYGAQRDKFLIFLNGRDFRSQLSIGERKALVYALKIALMLSSIEHKMEPIFMIDDFSSELDEARRSNIIRMLLKYASQIVITSTQSVEFDKIFSKSTYNLVEL